MPDVDGERALELADEALRRFDVDGVVAHLSAAIRTFTAAGDNCRAAVACVRLGDTLTQAMGNFTAGRAWFTRARRLVEHEPPCLEQGWVAVAAMGCDVDDPAELLAAAELALDRARRFGDVNLETKALADAGLAHVRAGRLSEGMSLLDEAMALACGPADDADTAARSVCSFFTACYHATDFGRAATWAGLLRQHGLIGSARGGPIFLSSHCDAVQATLLVELGRWGEAEAVLTRAKADFEAVMEVPAWHPDIALADLRARQGRLAEAEALLLGKDQMLEALLPAARLHLERGDPDLARVAARRGLRVVGQDRLRAMELLAVLVDTELAAGDVEAAGSAQADLTLRGRDLDVPALQARAAAAQARVLAATGDVEAALAGLEAALDRLDPGQLPWRRTVLLLDLARLRERAGDRAAATVDARTAVSLLAGLDVVLAAADVDLLERLVGSGPGRVPTAQAAGHPRAARTPGTDTAQVGGTLSPAGADLTGGKAAAGTATLARDGKWWVASHAGTHARLRDSKGLRYLAELVSRPGVERHALDLVDRIEGSPPPGGIDRRALALGDAGELLDAQARTAYRHRIEELRVDVDDALAEGRLETAEALQGELDQLVAQLARAFGLGGRSRRAASAAERARLNVTRALRAAIGKLSEALPAVAGSLDRRVRTGLYCAYEPGDGDANGDSDGDADEVRWVMPAEAAAAGAVGRGGAVVQSGVNGTAGL